MAIPKGLAVSCNVLLQCYVGERAETDLEVREAAKKVATAVQSSLAAGVTHQRIDAAWPERDVCGEPIVWDGVDTITERCTEPPGHTKGGCQDNRHGCSCGMADYGAPGHDGGPELCGVMLGGGPCGATAGQCPDHGQAA